MNHLGLLYPAELDEAQKTLYDTFTDYTAKYAQIVETKLPDGRFIGPFAVQLHSPAVGHHFLGLAKELAHIPGLPSKAREIAIITTGAKSRADYELYAHEILGKMQGVTQAEFDQIMQGKKPETLDRECGVAYDVARELVAGAGPLDAGLWEEAANVLGKDGAMALVQYCGFYAYVCAILRGFACEVPETKKQ